MKEEKKESKDLDLGIVVMGVASLAVFAPVVFPTAIPFLMSASSVVTTVGYTVVGGIGSYLALDIAKEVIEKKNKTKNNNKGE